MPLSPTARLTKPLAATWVSRFKEQSLERGRRYAKENRVRIVQIGDRLITASCQGSGENTYRQTIDLRELHLPCAGQLQAHRCCLTED